jgi:hypothetical protein
VAKALDPPAEARPPDSLAQKPLRLVSKQCPVCGHVELSDAFIPGICVMCPGLVELKRV